jgi:hypothetical protein
MDLPADPQLRWILSRTATLLEAGAEPVGGLVLPTATFFPDAFDGSPRAVAALLTRIQLHAGLADVPFDLVLFSPNAADGEAKKVSCSSGACGSGAVHAKLTGERVTARDDGGYTITIAAGEVLNPLILTTAMVRAVASVFLREADAYGSFIPEDREAVTDLAGVLLGFGVLLANGSYIYAKGCGGVQVQSATKLPVDEITVALGLFCRLFDVPERTAAKHLELTPSEHFDEGYAWASSNVAVVKLLRSDPDAVRADRYRLSESRSWLARALGVGKSKRPATPDEEVAELERAMIASAPKSGAKKADPAKARRLAELRALVDESLESP